jgi:hypothetical protein
VGTSDPDDYTWWRRDGVTPYRGDENGPLHVFSAHDDGWMRHGLSTDDVWPTTADVIAGMIGGPERLTEEVRGAMPTESLPDESYAPADSSYSADALASDPDLQDDSEGMSEQEIRDRGLLIDLPFEAPTPKDITYKAGIAKQPWVPPPGWGEGWPAISSDPDPGNYEGQSATGDEGT